jgi:hypothetical protein
MNSVQVDARKIGRHLASMRELLSAALAEAAIIHASHADRETVRVQTLALRAALDGIEESAGDAGDHLDSIETAAGLCDEDGKRLDE